MSASLSSSTLIPIVFTQRKIATQIALFTLLKLLNLLIDRREKLTVRLLQRGDIARF